MERGVPLSRDQIQVAARVRQPLGLKPPEGLPAPVDAPSQTRVREHVQMLSDRLTADGQSSREPRNGELSPRAETRHDREAGLVTKGREDGDRGPGSRVA